MIGKCAGGKDLTTIMSGYQDYESHISIVGGFVLFLGGFVPFLGYIVLWEALSFFLGGFVPFYWKQID